MSNCCLRLPLKVYDLMSARYRAYTWEQSLLNEELLQDSLWRLRSKVPKSKGEWQAVYTMTKDSLVETTKTLIRRWEKRWPWESAQKANVRDLQSTRPRWVEDEEGETTFIKIAAATCFLGAWLRPKVETEFGNDGLVVLNQLWACGSHQKSMASPWRPMGNVRGGTNAGMGRPLGLILPMLTSLMAVLLGTLPSTETAVEKADATAEIAKKWTNQKNALRETSTCSVHLSRTLTWPNAVNTCMRSRKECGSSKLAGRSRRPWQTCQPLAAQMCSVAEWSWWCSSTQSTAKRQRAVNTWTWCRNQ